MWEFRDFVDESNEVRFLDCSRTVITVSCGKLCHDDPDREETSRQSRCPAGG